IAAALAMRVAEHAASEGDVDAALAALLTAIKHDPSCIPARALQLDLLADGGDPRVFAGQLEAFAEHLTNDDARGRAYFLAAYVWGARAKDAAGAKAALTQAATAQVPALTLARVAKAIAGASGDVHWYDEASRRVITALTSPRDGEPRSLDPTSEAEVS